MTTLLLCGVLFLCVVISAVLSGAETGLYSLSRTRVEAEARAGSGPARRIEFLLRDDARLLITLLFATALVDEAATSAGLALFAPLGLGEHWREIVVSLALTPLLLFFGGILPKDLFRRRPHALVGRIAQPVAAISVLLFPFVWPLRVAVAGLFRALNLHEHELARVTGREAVIELLRERDEDLTPELERMARKVLELRSVPVEHVMVPWKKVETLLADADAVAARERLERTGFSRLPVVEAGGAVLGYVHQLEVLAAGTAVPASEHLRPLTALPLGLSIDRALARLRKSGQRMAVVGTLARPQGLVTLKDLVEEISGELYRW
ncbi:MAG: CNNM domain-containing protein [Planctomycetes bacterium]|nr:CNNM domain-containing protein [Planctomycetota bacterium]